MFGAVGDDEKDKIDIPYTVYILDSQGKMK